MDNCHARDQRTADIAGHGKNYFDGENVEKRRRYFRLEKIILRKKKWNAMRQLFRNLRIHFMECRTKRNT